MRSLPWIAGAVFCLSEMVAAGETAVSPTADRIECAVRDRQESQAPDRVRLAGWVGTRIAGNAANRMVKIDTDRLLEGYRQRPGARPGTASTSASGCTRRRWRGRTRVTRPCVRSWIGR